MSSLHGALLTLFMGADAVVAAGLALPDPTRPPPEIAAPRTEQEAVIGRNRGLQVVVIAPGRRAAVIDGHSVELGAKYDGYTLVEVSDGAAVLQDAGGRRRMLSMFPENAIKRKEPPPAGEKSGNTGAPDAGQGVSGAPPQGTK